jgi:pSer/pThr/pTyr-binding forkhead associated (FHA) protein
VGALWGKASQEPKGAVLIVLEGPDKGAEFPIAGEMTIGRTQDNSLVRVERGVSRRHCSIRDEGGVYTLEDKSANGTIINEKKAVGLEVLRHGDRVVIGESTFLFHWPEGHVEAGLSTSPGVGSMSESTQPGGGAGGAEKKASAGQGGLRRLLRKPLVLVALAVVALIVVALAAKVLCTGADPLGPQDLSEEPVRYSESNDFLHQAFGLGNNDDAHPDKAIIDFEYLKGRVTLRYSAWGVDESGEIQILLNGAKVGAAPVTQEYRHEIQLELPRDALHDGVNRLEFDSTRNPPGDEPWEIGYVRIVHEPFLPSNPEAAQAQYQQGLRFYEDREVDPANRFHALEKFRMTRNLLEQAQPRPPMYDEASAMMERVSEELNELFELGRFSAERAYRFDDVDEARGYLQRTLRYFPDQDDIRREQLSRALEALEGQ